MTQTMPEKLELIAKYIREGREVERKRLEVEAYHGKEWISVGIPDRAGDCVIFSEYEYRAKPERPRMGLLKVPCGETEEWKEICVKAYEATPEVEKALEDAGLI